MRANLDPAKAAFVKRLLRDRDEVRRELKESQRSHWADQAESARRKLAGLETELEQSPELANDASWLGKWDMTQTWLRQAEQRGGAA